MTTILNNLTVGILTHDKSSTFEKTLNNLKSQEYQPIEIILIKNIFPVYKAVFQLMQKAKTEFVIVLDDDITFLNSNAINQMVDHIQKNNVNEVLFLLNDPIFGIIKGIRIYRTNEIQKIIQDLKITNDWDVDINNELKKNNKTLTTNIVIANHHKEWNDIDIYWKMFTIAKKLQKKDKKHKHSWIIRHLTSLCNIKQNDKLDPLLILYSFCGLVDGLRNNKDEPFLSYEHKFNNKLFDDLKRSIEDE